MRAKEPNRYIPPKDGTRASWDEPRPESVKDNFVNFPELPHSTDVGKEPVSTVDKAPIREKPVPVEITNPTLPTRAITGWVAGTMTLLPGDRREIANRRSNRTLLRLLNTTAAKTLWIGNEPDVSETRDSWPLLPAANTSDYLEMKHQREVYAYNPDPAVSIIIAFYAEYILEIE